MSEAGAGLVVAGAGLAGLTVAETLRADGYDGPITLVGDEAHAPYHRPPLSKAYLVGEAEEAQLAHDRHAGRNADRRSNAAADNGERELALSGAAVLY